MSEHSAEKDAAFRVDEDSTLRFKNGVACGSVLREVDGYYVWHPSEGGGSWESAYLRKIADLLDQMNAEWDAVINHVRRVGQAVMRDVFEGSEAPDRHSDEGVQS